jgi:hypothetical protein
MPLMMRVAFDHRKLSPKWSIQGPREPEDGEPEDGGRTTEDG